MNSLALEDLILQILSKNTAYINGSTVVVSNGSFSIPSSGNVLIRRNTITRR
jgi:hypothetical protein